MSKFLLSAFADEIADDLTLQMDELEKYGINHIEMRKVNGKNLVNYTLDEVRQIKLQLDKRGFKISAIGSPIGKVLITSDFGPQLELFRHTIEIAKIFETKYIRIFSFIIPEGEDFEKSSEEVIERWRLFLKAAEGSGIILLHENEKGLYGDIPERCLRLLKTLDSPYARAIFDASNFVQCDVNTYPDAYELLKDYIEYLQIKDAKFSDHHVVPAGYGDGKVDEILAALHKSGFEGFLSLEPHLQIYKGFKDAEPNSSLNELPDGGPKEFAIAYFALNKLLTGIDD